MKNVVRVLALSSNLIGEETLERSQSIMQHLEYDSQIAHDMLQPTLFCANTDDYRFHSLLRALEDKRVNIIWPGKGGYGATRIVERLFEIPKMTQQKHFIGFSDLTAIHLFLYQEWGWNTIHGLNYMGIEASFNGITRDPHNFSIARNILEHRAAEIKIENLCALNNACQRIDSIASPITGGNLSLIQASIGCRWEIKPRGHVLVLEDLREQAYKVDRLLEHLRQAGIFDNITALVFGTFSSCPNDDQAATMEDALSRTADLLDKMNIPVFQTSSIGHEFHNYPFIYGAQTKIFRKDSGENSDVFIMQQEVPSSLAF